MAERTVRISISGNSESAQRSFKELQEAASKAGIKMSEDSENSSHRVGGAFRSMVGSAIGLIGAYLSISAIKNVVSDATSAFGDQQTATVLLNQALKDTGQKVTPALNSALSTADDAMLKYGDTTAVTENALQTLILRGVPAKAAIGDLGEIANIAAAQHTTLAAATTEVAKAASGKMSPALKELGAETLPKGVTGVKALNLILSEVNGHVAGAAAAVSKTMPGALATLGATITDKVMVPIGQFIDKGLILISNWVAAHSKDISNVLAGAMTVLGAAGTVVSDVFGWVIKNLQTIGPIAIAAAAAFATYQAITLTVAAATKIWAAIQAAFNLVMDANPVVVVALAIAGLVAAVVLAYQKVGWFRDFCKTAFGVVSTVIGDVVGALKDIINWSGWGVIGGIFSRVFGAIGTVISGVVTAITDIVTGIKDVIGWLGKLGGGSSAPAKAIAAKGGAIEARVPMRGAGGPVSAGQSYLMGENGPEIYTVNATGFVTPNSQLNNHGAAAGGNVFYQTFNIVSNDGTAVVNALRKYSQANGAIPITVRRASTVGSG